MTIQGNKIDNEIKVVESLRWRAVQLLYFIPMSYGTLNFTAIPKRSNLLSTGCVSSRQGVVRPDLDRV
jgi:hypothetical protein